MSKTTSHPVQSEHMRRDLDVTNLLLDQGIINITNLRFDDILHYILSLELIYLLHMKIHKK